MSTLRNHDHAADPRDQSEQPLRAAVDYLMANAELDPAVLRLLSLATTVDTSVRALGDAMAKLPVPVSPPLARALQAAENFWGRMEEEFGLLTAAEVGHLLGSRSNTARNLAGRKHREGLLLGIERGQRVLYPGFQFDHEAGIALPQIAELRRLGTAYQRSETGIAQWLCRRTTYLDDGDGAQRPVDLLATEPDRVVAVAEAAWDLAW